MSLEGEKEAFPVVTDVWPELMQLPTQNLQEAMIASTHEKMRIMEEERASHDGLTSKTKLGDWCRSSSSGVGK